MAGMKGLKKKRRIQVIVIAFVALGLATWLIGTAMKDGINLYRSPSEVMAEPPSVEEVFQIGGLVEAIQPDEGVRFFFDVTDGAETIPVHYVGNDPKPDLFKEGQGTIATGTYDGQVFKATRILAKHDEEYLPREVIDTLKETGVYQEPGS
jgi:cytochrome c-type biogenesis protein CcmE